MALEKVDASTLDPARTVVVATGNAHKLVEIETILGQALPGVRFVAVSQLGDFDDPEETGTTFAENALIKAEAAVAETGFAAVADDSGLMVDALDGEPGVFSARYAGVHGDDAANNAKLLAKLEGVTDEYRTARFVSSIAFIAANGLVTMGEGYCEGVIGHEERGDHGFGYDPLFLPDDTPGKTMAELTPEEKNAISHRFHALQDLCAKLNGAAAGVEILGSETSASDVAAAPSEAGAFAGTESSEIAATTVTAPTAAAPSEASASAVTAAGVPTAAASASSVEAGEGEA